MSQKLGFWSIFSLVISSQIGSGILILPSNLAQFGIFSLIGWILSGCAAITLSLSFAKLSSILPQGGPHKYLQNTFGDTAAFFTGWTYWMVSWISTTTVIITTAHYLSPIFGINDKYYLIVEIFILLIIIILNLKGIHLTGQIESILTILKFIPLIIIPIIAIFKFNIQYCKIDHNIELPFIYKIINETIILTFWGFIGLESATTQSELVHNPNYNIPKATIIGTCFVAIIYIINHLGIIGLIPKKELILIKDPYNKAIEIIFGGQWHMIMGCIGSIICISTLQSWVMTSSQIILGLAKDKFMPNFLTIKNKYNSATWSIIISCIGIIPILIIVNNSKLSTQINEIINFSVIIFIFIYLACNIALLKLTIYSQSKSYSTIIISIGSIIFCIWILINISLQMILMSTIFIVSGLPMYIFWYKIKYFYKNI